MHPEKESGYILGRLVDEWRSYFYGDGWMISVTWERDRGEMGEWELRVASRDDAFETSRYVTRDEWTEHHFAVVDAYAEAMYFESCKYVARAS